MKKHILHAAVLATSALAFTDVAQAGVAYGKSMTNQHYTKISAESTKKLHFFMVIFAFDMIYLTSTLRKY